MKLAVTWENGEVFQHFGHTKAFALYEVAEGEIVKEQVVQVQGAGHGALAGFLRELGVETLLCGGIGQGAQQALRDAGITLYGGVTGSARDAAKAYLQGNLSYDEEARCSNPGHHHSQGAHACGSGGCHHHEGECSCH